MNQDTYLGEHGTPPSLHRYLYAYSNPTVYVDSDGFASTATILDEWATNAAQNDEKLKLAAVVTAQAFYKMSDVVTFGWISGHDEARDLRDTGQISDQEYYQRTAVQTAKSDTLFAATVATGGVTAVATRGLGTGAVATTTQFAASGIGCQAASDAWNGEISSVSDYAKSAGMGLLGGVATRGALGVKAKLGNTTVGEGVKSALSKVKSKTIRTNTAEAAVTSGSTKAPNFADSAATGAKEGAKTVANNSRRALANTNKSRSQEPSDPYDVAAWNRYYAENPGVGRSVGAKAVSGTNISSISKATYKKLRGKTPSKSRQKW